MEKIYSFKEEDYDPKYNTITISMGSYIDFIKYERENNRKLLPEVLLKSPTGNIKKFTNPAYLLGKGMAYYCDGIRLKLLW